MKVFVSYQATDESIAQRVQRQLRQLPNISPYSLPLHAVIDDRSGRKVFQMDLLYRALSFPDVAIIILSPHYLADPWFYQEMPGLFALEQELRSELIIPILTDGVDDDHVPHYLRGRNHIDFRGRPLEEGLLQLSTYVQGRENRRSSEIFIVHGHGDRHQVVARFLENLGLTPVILEERPSASNTIIEKLEQHRNVGYAVAVITPDDLGAVREKIRDPQARPRQNVIFELGFFIGILERHRVCAMVSGFDGPPTEFSDFSGVLHVSMDRADWQIELAKELRDQGFAFDSEVLLNRGKR